MTTQDLIARLEGAEAGGTELDGLIWRALFVTDISNAGGVIADAGKGLSGPFTTSLDAALALAERVMPGCRRDLIVHADTVAVIYHERAPEGFAEAAAQTPALALCISILRAHSAQSTEPAKEAVAS